MEIWISSTTWERAGHPCASSLTSNLKSHHEKYSFRKLWRTSALFEKSILSSQLPQPEQLLVLELLLGTASAALGNVRTSCMKLWSQAECQSVKPNHLHFNLELPIRLISPQNTWQGTTSPASLHFWQLYLHFQHWQQNYGTLTVSRPEHHEYWKPTVSRSHNRSLQETHWNKSIFLTFLFHPTIIPPIKHPPISL